MNFSPARWSQLERLRRGLCAPRIGVVALAVGLASCSDGAAVAVHPVTGRVRVGDEAPAGAQVVLHPQGHALPPNVVATGAVRADGTFEIGTYDVADGAPAGEYSATIQWFKVVTTSGGSGRGPNVLPRRYADPTTTPVRVSVAEGANQVAPIQIRR